MSIHTLARATLLLTARVEQLFANKKMYLRSSSPTDVTLGALLRSSCRTARAIIVLARAGYGANALGVSRSLIETWITIRYLTNTDTENRVRRFRDFNSKLRERIMQLIGEYYPGVDLSKHEGKRQHDLKALEYRRWDTWGPGVKAMAKEEEALQDELVGANSPAFAYDVAFFASSYYLHPTPLGLQHHFLNPGDIFSFQSRSDEKEVVEQALNFSAHTIALCAFRIGLFWKNDTADSLIEFWNRWNDCVSKSEKEANTR